MSNGMDEVTSLGDCAGIPVDGGLVCESCGLALVEHLGLIGACAELQRVTAERDDLRAQLRASRKLIDDPKSTGEFFDPATEVVVPREEWDAMCAIGFDPEPCRFDHHGYCQEHNWFRREPCPTGILQQLHAIREGGAR